MRYRAQGKSALETRVDYVESRLDETIGNFKDAITDLKEAIRDNKEATQHMEKELKATLEKSMAKAESSKRWAITLVITVALAVIGFILTNGFQIQF